MKRPFITVRAISKQNKIIRILVKEGSKVLKYRNGMKLIRISKQIENISCSWNGICDNNDLFNV